MLNFIPYPEMTKINLIFFGKVGIRSHQRNKGKTKADLFGSFVLLLVFSLGQINDIDKGVCTKMNSIMYA